MNIPFSYADINLTAGFYKPSTQKSYNNETFAYWARALFQRASYAIKLNLPEEWDGDRRGIFSWWLYMLGFVGIFRDPDLGLIFQPGTLYGHDVYYQPTNFLITNPYFPGAESKDLKIGEDIALIRLSPDLMGIGDIIDFYARKLADLSLSIDMSIINTRFAKILGARNMAAAETLKKILDKVNSGQPAVIYDQKLTDDRTDKAAPFQEFGIENLKNNYITDQQLRDMQTILNAFDNEVGIPTVPYQKQERLVDYEARSKQTEAIARVTVWIETLNDCFRKANKMFGTDLRAELRTEGGQENGIVYDDNTVIL